MSNVLICSLLPPTIHLALKIERSLHLICNVDVIYSVQGYLHLVRVKCQDVHHSVFSSIAIDNLALVLSVSYFKEKSCSYRITKSSFSFVTALELV